MINFKIKVEEVSPGRCHVSLEADGSATPLEFEMAEVIRESVQGHVQTYVAENGEGTSVLTLNPDHGKRIPFEG